MHDCMHKSQSENKAMLWQYHDLESILSEKITKLGQVINQNTTGVKFSYDNMPSLLELDGRGHLL